MRKSNTLSHHYRPGTSRGRPDTASFRNQMADYARGDVLLSLRSTARKSRETVAADIGVTAKTLYSWEKTNSAIKWENAKALAKYYSVEPDSLVTRDADEAAGLPSREQLDRIEAKLDALEEIVERVFHHRSAQGTDIIQRLEALEAALLRRADETQERNAEMLQGLVRDLLRAGGEAPAGAPPRTARKGSRRASPQPTR